MLVQVLMTFNHVSTITLLKTIMDLDMSSYVAYVELCRFRFVLFWTSFVSKLLGKIGHYLRPLSLQL